PHRLLEVELERVAQIRATGHAAAGARAGGTEDVAEHVAEDVAEAAGAEAAAEPAAVDAGVTEAVVGRALLRVREHLVRFAGFAEALGGLLVARIAVRVVLHRKTPVGLLYFGLTGVPGDAQHLVVVAFRHVRRI